MMKATITQIAAFARVGTATVDRVLNGRTHVKDTTRQRVLQAKEALEAGLAPRANTRPWRLKVLLPGDAGPSTERLALSFERLGFAENAIVECDFAKKLEPALLARKLNACAGQGIDAVAFQALDHPMVHSAVNNLSRLNICTIALLSGLETPAVLGVVGIDNRAAGRTAGYLMGRMTRQTGAAVIVTGGQLYRSHEDREIGFRTILRQRFPHITDVIVCSGRDDTENNHDAVAEILERRKDIIGLYNVGAGNLGIGTALKERGISDEIFFLGHNLTPDAHAMLLDGTMDIVLAFDMQQVANQAISALVSKLENRPVNNPKLVTIVLTQENCHLAT